MSSDTDLQASLVYVVHNVLPLHIRRVLPADVKHEDPKNIYRSGVAGANFVWAITWDTDHPKYHLRFLGEHLREQRELAQQAQAQAQPQANNAAAGNAAVPSGEGAAKARRRESKQPQQLQVAFVGVPEIFVPAKARYGLDKILSNNFDCYAVFLEREVAHQHYQGFCKGVLWPLMHNVIDMYSSADYLNLLTDVDPASGVHKRAEGRAGQNQRSSRQRPNHGAGLPAGRESDNEETTDWKERRSWNPLAQEKCWPQHCAANAAFAHKLQVIRAELGGGAGSPIIWVHGYELLLLPSYLLRKLPNANVGLFLDLPFPSSEIFRTLACREEILRAMLSASHIGFHLFEYARHFLTCCKRMLGVDYTCEQGGQIQILNNRRKVWVTCCHGGVPVRALQELAVPNLVPHGSVVLASRQSSGQPGPGTSFLSESSHYFGSDDDGDGEDEAEAEKAGSVVSGGANDTLSAADSPTADASVVHTRETNSAGASTTNLCLDSAASQPPSAPMDDELICRIFGSMEKFRSVVLGGGADGRRRTRQVIVGLDPLEALRGIPLKLLAFDRFLSENRDWASRVVLVQIGLELDSRPDDYARVSRDVDTLVDALRRRWGDALFYCRLPSVTTAERKRLWQLGDVYFNVPLRVGLDTMPLEFLVVREQHNHDIMARNAREKAAKRQWQQQKRAGGAGAIAPPLAPKQGLWEEKVLPLQASVIISEMCGSSRVLSSAVRVNAYKTADVANGLHTALVSWDSDGVFFKASTAPSEQDSTTTATEASDMEGVSGKPGARGRRRGRGPRGAHRRGSSRRGSGGPSASKDGTGSMEKLGKRLQVTVTTPAVVQDLQRVRQNNIHAWATKVLLDIEGAVAANREELESDDDDDDDDDDEEGEDDDDDADGAGVNARDPDTATGSGTGIGSALSRLTKRQPRAPSARQEKRSHKKNKSHRNGAPASTVAVRIGFGFGLQQLHMGRNRLDMKSCSAAYTGSWRRVLLLQHEKILQELDTTHMAYKQGPVPRLGIETPEVVGLAHARDLEDEVLGGRQGGLGNGDIAGGDNGWGQFGTGRGPLSFRARKQLWEVKNILTRLCEDPKNKVCVLSAGPRHVLERLLGDIPQLDLIAEAGFVSARGTKRILAVSDPQTDSGGASSFSRKSERRQTGPGGKNGPRMRPREWACVMGEDAAAALQEMLARATKIVRMYCDRTNGAVLVASPSMVCFDYYHADPEFGDMQANSLKAHLAAAFRDEPMQVLVQDLCLTITHSHVSYMHALRNMYGELARPPSSSASTFSSASSPGPAQQHGLTSTSSASALLARGTGGIFSRKSALIGQPSGHKFFLAVGTKRFNPVFKALYDRSAHAQQSQQHGFRRSAGIISTNVPAHTPSRGAKVFTVTTVHSSTAEARFFVDDAEEARAIFSVLANLSSKMSRSVSTAAVTSLSHSSTEGGLFQKSGAGALGGFTTKESLLDLRNSQLYHGAGSLGVSASKGSWGSFSALAAKHGGGIPVGPPTAAINRGLGRDDHAQSSLALCGRTASSSSSNGSASGSVGSFAALMGRTNESAGDVRKAGASSESILNSAGLPVQTSSAAGEGVNASLLKKYRSKKSKRRRSRSALHRLFRFVLTLLMRIWQSAVFKYLRQLLGLGAKSDTDGPKLSNLE